MKKLLLTVLLFTYVAGFGQQKNFKINWEDFRTIQYESSSLKVPSFNKDNFNFSFEDGLTFIDEWKSSGYVDERGIEFVNIVYQNISESDLKDLNPQLIPNKLEGSLKNATARGVNSLSLRLSPIIKENNAYKKIVSFSVNYVLNASKTSVSARDSNDIENSVLSSGEWYKFYVDKSGVFKIDKSFLNQLGVNTEGLDPRIVKIYGNGGAMLPLSNNADYPLDLTENAIKTVGGSDGVFDNEDYILFYAEGPFGYNEESDTHVNLYTEKSCYFVNIGSGVAKSIEPLDQPEAQPDVIFDRFQDYQFYEVDEYNLAKLGRRWFGDKFDIELERSYEFDFPNLDNSVPVNIKILGGSTAEATTSFDVFVNSTSIGNLGFTPVQGGSVLAVDGELNVDLPLSSDDIEITLTYNNGNNPSSKGYLDYIAIDATRFLTYDGDQLMFSNIESGTIEGVVQYDLNEASNVLEIWDLSDKYNVKSISNLEQLSNLSFKDFGGRVKNYVAFSLGNVFTPLIEGITRVNNQNIKGTVFQNSNGSVEEVDYIIVTPKIFQNQAERLAQINRDQYQLAVKVFNLEEIYLEFSSGNQDISAIRNLMKYVYDNAYTQTGRVKYLCLFGDASYDFKDRLPDNTNFVPSWYSKTSFSLTSSFVSDDYFGLLDDQEGTNLIGSDRLDIAVGRILATSPQSAKELVDKIEGYYQKEAFGSWRNNFIGVSDDVDEAWEAQLQETTNNICNEVTEEKPFMNSVKIFADAFEQESSSAGNRYPKVNKAFKDAIEVGALVVNFFGHGGEDGLAHERIFDKVDAKELNNVCKFNLFVTITCEYTKFDDPGRPTAGEFVYWNKDAGSIALITTTRQIFVTPAREMNETLEQYLFAYGSNEYPSIAESLRLMKIDPEVAGNDQKRLIFFIGDPAMKLAFAKPNIVLTMVNDIPTTENSQPLRAKDRVKLSGVVTDDSGNTLNNFNGVLTAAVYDKPIQRQTLGNDGVEDEGDLIIMDFETLGNIIFKGQATVENGNFDFEFVVPKDISVPLGPGKVNFYAVNSTQTEDRGGSSYDIVVGGINNEAPEDNDAPLINLFMNDENFISGGITNESPSLLAKLSDANGINTVSGIGHDITAILDGDETNPVILNDYYLADVDDFTSGTVTFPFRDLEPGIHTLTFKAWDVYNNSATSEIQFVVYDKDETLKVTNVLNYPNPFVSYTEFWFNHNSAEPLDVSVQIFTVSGKLVRTLNGQTSGGIKNVSSLSKDIVWDGRDDFGEKIGKGVYVYKLKVKSNRLNKQVEKIQKLVIL